MKRLNNDNMSRREFLKKLGIGKFTGWTSPAGFCEYPLYQFNREALSAYSL